MSLQYGSTGGRPYDDDAEGRFIGSCYATNMSVLFIALPVALLLAITGVIAFIWSVRSGQLDDLETPGIRPLIEDDPVAKSERKDSKD